MILKSSIRFLVFTIAALIAVDVPPAIAQLGVLVGWGIQSDAILFNYNNPTNAVAAAASAQQTLWLNRDGTVGWSHGYAAVDLGSGAASLSNVAAISLGHDHALALLSNGTVVAWGGNSTGQGTAPPGLNNVTAIAAGGYHNLAVSNGTVIAWGDNSFGQLNVPPGLVNVTAVAASTCYNSSHSLALKSDGTVVAWGQNSNGQCDVPADLSNVVAIAAGWYHSVALRNDGTVVAWGGDGPAAAVVPAGLSGVIAIAASGWQSLALKSDRTIVAWGHLNGSSEPVPASFTNVIGIAAGVSHNLAILADGKPLLLTHPISYPIAAGSSYYISASAAGPRPHIYQWLKDGHDVSEPEQRDASSYSAYSLYNAQLENEGNFSVRVSNPFGTVTSLVSHLTVVPAGPTIWGHPTNTSTYQGGDATLGVFALGSNPLRYQWFETNRPGFAGAVPIDGATNALLTLTNVQGLYTHLYFAMASNDYGWATSRVGQLVVTNRDEKPIISVQPSSDSLFAGARFVLSVGAGGAPPLNFHWFKNGSGLSAETAAAITFNHFTTADAGNYQVIVSNSFGTATSSIASLTVSSRSWEPLPPPGVVVNLSGGFLPADLTNMVAIAAGATHALAVRADGTVTAWAGDSASHFLSVANVPAGVSNAVSVAAGQWTSFVLMADGTVYRWGFGGQGVVPGLFGVVALSAQDHALALKSDGRVVNLSYGQVPASVTNASAIGAGGHWDVIARTDGQVSIFGPGPFGWTPPSNIVRVAAMSGGYLDGSLIGLRNDGAVVSLTDGTSLPALSNVVNISAAYGRGLALKNDGTVAVWGNITTSASLSNAAAIAAGRAYILVLTTNPPPPALAAKSWNGQLQLSAPVSVSGFVLEASDDPAEGFTIVTNVAALSDTNSPVLQIPTDGTRKFYRLRKF